MFLLKDITQWRRWGSNPRPFGLESSTLPLSHYAPLYADLFLKLTFSQKKSKKKSGIPGAIRVPKVLGQDQGRQNQDQDR